MKYLNRLRLNAGLPMDLSIEGSDKEEKKLTEARETPKMRSDLAPKDKRSLGSRVRGVQRAMDHIRQAIAVLEKVPATDYSGEIPHFIGELEDLLDGGDGGMTGYLERVQGEHDEFGKEPEPEPEMDDVEDAEPEPEMDMEPEMDDVEADAEMGADEELARESDDDDFLKNLSADEKEQLKTAIATLRMISGGPMLREAMEEIAEKAGKTLEEAMHYYNVNYDSFEDVPKGQERPINVTDGSANDEQIVDTLDAPKKEGPEQLRTMDQQDNSEQDKSGDDLSVKVKVPNGIKQALRTEIEAANREAKKQDTRNKDAAYFYKDMAKAFEDLLGHLEKGTRYDMKQAQIFAQTLMGPMLHKIPNEVWKFIANAGEARSLKSYMEPVDKKFPITGPRNTLK